ncbi:MAG: Two-component system response regulator [Myxococcaceae bacterium]|nr:Two-component system response regulator [Myxococcaceae bacterium]MEA2747736.1 two-component system, LytTR family, response regulator LytT [Myxococcales bacterium]
MSAPITTHPSKLRALVVEDEWPARNYLVELLEASNLADVVGAVANVDEAKQALGGTTGLTIDVAFVDVRLAGDGDAAGLEVVRSLAGKPEAPMFVLATAFEHHAVEAFRLDVVDYLLKPFNEERVEQCLMRLLARRPLVAKPVASTRIVARRGKTLVFLERSEVWAFEAADRLTQLHSEHGTFDVDLTLSVIEASFGRGLMRVHRNWLVNAAHIRELERDGRETMIFVGAGLGADRRGLTIPVSRDRAQAMREMLLATATGLRRS